MGSGGAAGECPQSGELIVGRVGDAGSLARRLWVQPRSPSLRWGSFGSSSRGCPRSSELVMDARGLAMGFGGVAMGPAADAHGLVGQLWVWLGLPLV